MWDVTFFVTTGNGERFKGADGVWARDRQLRQFIAVVEHGNVRRAADAIHLSQPALTKSTHNLEEGLGVQLLVRAPRGVTPTIYGDLLLRHARLLRNEGERAVAEIHAVKAGHVGRDSV
jgi:DNA-binding transcriptional LysR family regulator